MSLPPGIEPDDEIAITWSQGEDGTTVTAELGGAKLTVTTDDESVELVPWLVAAAPQILSAAWAQLELEEQANTEAEEATSSE